MNQLINDVFGDGFITLACEGAECLHYTQVPGYQVPLHRNLPAVSLTQSFSLAPSETQSYSMGCFKCGCSGFDFPFCIGGYVYRYHDLPTLNFFRPLVCWPPSL